MEAALDLPVRGWNEDAERRSSGEGRRLRFPPEIGRFFSKFPLEPVADVRSGEPHRRPESKADSGCIPAGTLPIPPLVCRLHKP